MSDNAKQRIAALSNQLSPQSIASGSFEGISTVKKVAGPSNGPRAQGKVVIITGTLFLILFHDVNCDIGPRRL